MKYALYAFLADFVKKDGWEKTARFAKENGFTHVEFLTSVKHPVTGVIDSVKEAEEVRACLASHGLSMACYSVGGTFFGDDGTKEEMLREHIRRAAAAGSPFVHHTLILEMPRPAGAPSYEEVLTPITDFAVRTAEYAKTLGVRCLYEPQGAYFNGYHGFSTVYRAIRARTDNAGICADVGNPMYVDEELLPILREFAGDVYHVHIKDILRLQTNEPGVCFQTEKGTYLKEVPPGEGDIDFAPILHVLKQVNYKGVFSLEGQPDVPFLTSARAFQKLLCGFDKV